MSAGHDTSTVAPTLNSSNLALGSLDDTRPNAPAETSTVTVAPSYTMRSTMPLTDPSGPSPGAESLVNPTLTASTASEPGSIPSPLPVRTIPPTSTDTLPSPAPTTLPENMLDLPTKLATNGVAGFSKTSRGVPNCMILPLRMTAMRSAISRASSWSWVTWMQVSPISLARDLSSFLRSILRRASSALSGSSSRRIFDPDASARARAMRCCCPPDSSPGTQSAFWSRCTRCSMLLTIYAACS